MLAICKNNIVTIAGLTVANTVAGSSIIGKIADTKYYPRENVTTALFPAATGENIGAVMISAYNSGNKGRISCVTTQILSYGGYYHCTYQL